MAIPEGLKRFRELAGEFHAAVEQADATAQERILTERRRLMTVLARMEKPNDDDERESRSRVLTEILALDREAGELLDRQRAELGAELVALGAGKRGLAGYGLGARRPAKWIDERR